MTLEMIMIMIIMSSARQPSTTAYIVIKCNSANCLVLSWCSGVMTVYFTHVMAGVTVSVLT